MLKRLKSLFMWIGIILTMLVAWKAYDEYQFVQITNRAMDQLGNLKNRMWSSTPMAPFAGRAM